MASKDVDANQSDVSALLADVSPEKRADAVRQVASIFKSSLSDNDKHIAEEIFRTMLRDAEVRVRQALSESLKQNPLVPHDVALDLAQDVVEVAAPILSHSEVLTDADLVEIVKSQSPEHQCAIAERSVVSASVADALVDEKNEDVIAALVANDGAVLREDTLNTVVEEFGDNESVNGPMTLRRNLPIRIAERLVSLVSDELRDHLATHHELAPDVATDLILESRERATVTLLASGANKTDVMILVDQLAENDRLTPSILLRAICVGDLPFFEAALARLCRIPRVNAYALINDDGELGLRALCKRAGIPADMVDVIRIAVDVAREVDYDGGQADRERFVERMVARVLTTCEEEFEGESVDYLLGKLKTSVDVARNAEVSAFAAT